MEKVSSFPSSQTQPLWSNPSWYRAITLTERLLTLEGKLPEHLAATTEQLEQAKQQLQRWQTQTPLDKGSFFAQRLALDGLSEEGLLALLLESSASIQTRCATPPAWLVTLNEAFNTYPFLQLSSQPTQARTLYTILYPLLQHGRARLRAGLSAITEHMHSMPFETETMMSLLGQHLPQRLLQPLSKTFVLELNVARLQGQLQGEGPQARFESFLEQLCHNDRALALLEEYCVLTRYLVETIDRWVLCSLEFVNRLCTDWEELRRVFAPKHDPGQLVGLKVGAGDTHQGGHSVTLLAFSSGLHLVYKPRSLATEVHFQEVLAWLANHQFPLTFHSFTVLNKGSYGWTEYVTATSCSTQEEVQRFYERQGGYLAILYALGATDIHAENLIAQGEHPIIIDLETLLQPEPLAEALPLADYPAKQALSRSVFPIGFLPQKTQVNQEGYGIDISGLGCYEGQHTSQAITNWSAQGTDEMHATRETAKISISQNRPRLQDRPVRTLDYLEEVISGFTTAYRFLVACREDWLALLPRFAHDRIRFLPRQSQLYEVIRTESFYPNLLRDALRRERFFDRLWLGVSERPVLTRLIPAERADLLQGDIPMFTTFPDTRDLYTSQDERIPDVFATSSMDSLIARIRQMNEQDLQRQCWIIRASFVSLPEAYNSVSPPRPQLPLHPPVPDHDLRTRCLAAASAIREQLRQEAIISDNRAGWLMVNETKGHSWSIVPTDTSLHHGTAGILLFLAYLDAIEGGGKRDSLVEFAFNTLQTEIAHIKQGTPSATDNLIGGFTGLGSCIYLFSHLGVLWQDPSLFTAAEELVALLPELIDQDSRFDIMGGAAGCLMILISLYDVAPSACTLEAAMHCGNHLIAHARLMNEGTSLGWMTIPSTHPFSGFSHGAAGIATSLFQLAARSGETRFSDAALRALNYERTLFSPEQNNWRDQPVLTDNSSNSPAEDAEIFKMAWCYGAPGIGLSRLACLPYIDDRTIRDEIASALASTIAHGFGCSHSAFGSNHSLCHGDFGNLETLLVAAQILREPAYQEQVHQRATQLLDDSDKNGWITGVLLNIAVPGLMTGLAGIGYELLRIAEPKRVPSVLVLATPSQDQRN